MTTNNGAPGRGRGDRLDTLTGVRLDARTVRELDAVAAELGLCRSRLIREMIERELRRVCAASA